MSGYSVTRTDFFEHKSADLLSNLADTESVTPLNNAMRT